MVEQEQHAVNLLESLSNIYEVSLKRQKETKCTKKIEKGCLTVGGNLKNDFNVVNEFKHFKFEL